MQTVHGHVQHYEWGDDTFIPTLLGLEPDGRPWAELWLGTHPNGPTRLADDHRRLVDTVGRLPYLLKVLAAGAPLSLQAHPNAEQAADGFSRGVFPDDRPKPELLVALTDVDALCGVRPATATLALLDDLGAEALAATVRADGPGAALAGLYRGEIDPQPVIDACRDHEAPEARWVADLDARYPGEPSVAAALLLNLVHLSPGEAIRLDAGNLHAYLGGSGIELMGASDNVVRGGLTVKPVDIDELLAVVDPTPLEQPVLTAVDGRYDLPAAGVALQHIAPGGRHRARGEELGISLDGRTFWCSPGDTFTATADTYVVVPGVKA